MTSLFFFSWSSVNPQVSVPSHFLKGLCQQPLSSETPGADTFVSCLLLSPWSNPQFPCSLTCCLVPSDKAYTLGQFTGFHSSDTQDAFSTSASGTCCASAWPFHHLTFCHGLSQYHLLGKALPDFIQSVWFLLLPRAWTTLNPSCPVLYFWPCLHFSPNYTEISDGRDCVSLSCVSSMGLQVKLNCVWWWTGIA